MRILLIEDDKAIGSAIREPLAGDGQSVDWALRLDEAAMRLAAQGLIWCCWT